jgi:hypothetical protein
VPALYRPNVGTLNCLCSPFIESFSTGDDRTFFLAHSKVKDYLTTKPGFYTEKTGNAKLGEICLTYLTQPAFKTPKTAVELKDERFHKKHPFLKYGAIFWYKHLEYLEEDRDRVFDEVYEFWKSKNFRICIQIQSLYAPYHFAHFISLFDIDIRFGDPLPGWFADHNDNGRSAAYTFHCFVKEWGYYLRSHPGHLTGCIFGVIGDREFCGGIAGEESVSVMLGTKLREVEGINGFVPAIGSPPVPTRRILCMRSGEAIGIASCIQKPREK